MEPKTDQRNKGIQMMRFSLGEQEFETDISRVKEVAEREGDRISDTEKLSQWLRSARDLGYIVTLDSVPRGSSRLPAR
jgi:hypothetical protein